MKFFSSNEEYNRSMLYHFSLLYLFLYMYSSIIDIEGFSFFPFIVVFNIYYLDKVLKINYREYQLMIIIFTSTMIFNDIYLKFCVLDYLE